MLVTGCSKICATVLSSKPKVWQENEKSKTCFYPLVPEKGEENYFFFHFTHSVFITQEMCFIICKTKETIPESKEEIHWKSVSGNSRHGDQTEKCDSVFMFIML